MLDFPAYWQWLWPWPKMIVNLICNDYDLDLWPWPLQIAGEREEEEILTDVYSYIDEVLQTEVTEVSKFFIYSFVCLYFVIFTISPLGLSGIITAFLSVHLSVCSPVPINNLGLMMPFSQSDIWAIISAPYLFGVVTFVIPPEQRSCWGVYWFHSVRLSVRLSVRPSVCPGCRVRSVTSTVLDGFFPY